MIVDTHRRGSLRCSTWYYPARLELVVGSRWSGAAARRPTMTLSPAAIIVLTRAAERPDRLLEFHRKLPPAAPR
jgi:hypothetical protein